MCSRRFRSSDALPALLVETYLSYPENRSTKRAILLCTDVIGHRFINAQLIADQLAANGYFVVMPDLFHGDPVPLNRPEGFELQAWLNGPPGHLTNRVDPVVQAVLKEMKSALGCERVGGIGYCFGVRLHLWKSEIGHFIHANPLCFLFRLNTPSVCSSLDSLMSLM